VPVVREETLELLRPGLAGLAVALADDEDGRRGGHEGLPGRAVEGFEGAHATNGSPFFQSAPHRPPLWRACTVRSVSCGLRPADRSLTDTCRTMPLSSTTTVARN